MNNANKVCILSTKNITEEIKKKKKSYDIVFICFVLQFKMSGWLTKYLHLPFASLLIGTGNFDCTKMVIFRFLSIPYYQMKAPDLGI